MECEDMNDLLLVDDITYICHSNSYSHDTNYHNDAERIVERIRLLEKGNSQLSKDIQRIKEDPRSVGLNALGEELRTKICVLERENYQLENLFNRSNHTPMKKDSLRQSLNTPRGHQKSFSKPTIQKSNTRMIRRSSHSILDGIDNDFHLEKAQVSTCQNYQMTHTKREELREEEVEGISQMKPLTAEQQKIRNGLRVQATIQDAKEKMVSCQLKTLMSEQRPSNSSQIQKHPQQLQRLRHYKQKLVKQMRKATLKEEDLTKILSQLDRLYNNSIERYRQLQSILEQQLRERENENQQEGNQTQIIERYHQALRLQQILNSLNSEYFGKKSTSERQSQQELSRLKGIKRELVSIVNKLKLNCDVEGLSLSDCIEAISLQIMDNVYLPNSKSVSSIAAKVARIRELNEVEKANNGKIITSLKGKEQDLSRQLMEKQLVKSKKLL